MSESNQEAKQALGNAEKIIELFGGIRPMASKINVAVTTVQGWKKRGVIPANRVDAVIVAASALGIDLSQAWESAPDKAVNVSENIQEMQLPDEGVKPAVFAAAPGTGLKFEEEVEEKTSEVEMPTTAQEPRKSIDVEILKEEKPEIAVSQPVTLSQKPEPKLSESIKVEKIQKPETPKQTAAPKMAKPQEAPHTKPFKGDFTELSVESDSKTLKRGIYISTALMALALVAGGAMFWPKASHHEQSQELASAEDTEGFKGLMPEDWSKRINDLKGEAEKAVNAISETAIDLEKEVTRPDGIVAQQAQNIENYVTEIAGENLFAALGERFDGLGQNAEGQKALDESMDALHGLVIEPKSGSFEDQEMINAKLDKARQENPDLARTLGGVPADDLQEAASFLAMTQLQDILSKSDIPFKNDIQTLMGLTGDDDAELQQALKDLEPYSEEGVPSVEGLQQDYQDVAQRVLEASLEGQDVSMVEKARARMNEVFQVEKNGELLTGTKTQELLNKANKLVEIGDIDGALDLLKSSLKAKELEPLRPWINKAEAVLSAKSVKLAIQRAVQLSAGDGYLGGSGLINKSR